MVRTDKRQICNSNQNAAGTEAINGLGPVRLPGGKGMAHSFPAVNLVIGAEGEECAEEKDFR